MAYVALCKALYDYVAQAEDELNLIEDETLYILESDDPEWWKAKLRRLNPDGTPLQGQSEEEADSLVGLVPANYVEEAEPLRLSRTLYDYEAQTDDELSVAEDELLRIYETDGLWLLVKKQGNDPLSGGEGRLGYVPANYVDEADAIDTGAAPVAEQEYLDPEELEEEIPAPVAAPAATPRISMLPSAAGKGDEIKMWPVLALDAKKKKKKGTLGIGNASLFFASESDKTPVQKISILHITDYNLEKGKNLHIDLSPDSGLSESSLDFHTGSKEVGSDIVKKIEISKATALTNSAAETSVQESAPAPLAPPPAPTPPPAPSASTPLPPPLRTAAGLPPPVRKTVSFQPQEEITAAAQPATNGSSGEEHAIALYDFEAQGDDELSVAENEALVVLEKENDDWWKVRNASGQAGVVPASYVEVTVNGATVAGDDGGAVAAEAEEQQRREKEEEATAAAAAAAQERQRKAFEAAERRKREAEERKQREEEEKSRREALKAQPAPTPPKLSQRPSTTEVNRAARNVAIPAGRSAPERPKDGGGRSKPSPAKTRMWIDRTGQFKVEAEFLGFNQGKIRLHKMNGVVIEVAIEKMSDSDIAYLEDVTGKKLAPNDDKIASRRRESSRHASGSHRDDRERERERHKEKEREQRRREQASRGPKRNIDWFEFFLAAGVDVDNCTRYASSFERDKIDETVLGDLDAGTLRSLGLREGDVIRVSKLIDRKYRRKDQAAAKSSSGRGSSTAADLERQIRADEDLARKLQDREGSALRGETVSPPPPQLFSGPDGTLKNNTRRGRPTPKVGTGSVDAASLAAASESLARGGTASPPVRADTVSPAVAPKRIGSTQPASGGFDNDAWTPRPPSTKPTTPAQQPAASPAPPAPTPPPAPAASAQPAVSPAPPADPNSALFDKLAAMKPPSAGASPRPGVSPSGNSFLGGNTFNPNASRGPFAPVPINQGLLSPLIPTTGTGQFVPTKMQSQQTGMMGMQMTGMMQPQQTGWGGSQMQQPQMTGYNGMNGIGMGQMGMGGGMQPQQTGFGNGMGMTSPSQFNGSMQSQQTGFLGMMQPQQQPQQTGFGGGMLQQQPQQTSFGGFGGQQQDDKDKFNATNIFQQMKTGNFAKDPNATSQPSQKYDALRPQPTGFQSGGVMQPQFTGMNFGQQQQQGEYGGYGGYQ